MKKRPPSKPKRPISSLSKQGIYKKDTTAICQDTQARKISKNKEKTTTSFLDGWKNFWAFAGPALSLVGAAAYWWPSVVLTTGVNLDTNQDFQTQFVVTNTGHVPVHDVSFVCALVGGRIDIGSLQGAPVPEPISILRPGDPASRGCFSESYNIAGVMLRVDAYYKWPLIGRLVSTRAYFGVRRGATGNHLVPEAIPLPEPQALIGVGKPPK